MRLVLAGLLLIVPLFAVCRDDFRFEARRARAEAHRERLILQREARLARTEAARELRRMRSEEMRFRREERRMWQRGPRRRPATYRWSL